jgi:hypothetical protein
MADKTHGTAADAVDVLEKKTQVSSSLEQVNDHFPNGIPVHYILQP